MATYYPLTLKEFIRGISTFCQLNRISINAEQLVKQYLFSIICSQQFASGYLNKFPKNYVLPNGSLTQVSDINCLITSKLLENRIRNNLYTTFILLNCKISLKIKPHKWFDTKLFQIASNKKGK